MRLFLSLLLFSLFSSQADTLAPLNNVPKNLKKKWDLVREARARHLPPEGMKMADLALQLYFDAHIPEDSEKVLNLSEIKIELMKKTDATNFLPKLRTILESKDRILSKTTRHEIKKLLENAETKKFLSYYDVVRLIELISEYSKTGKIEAIAIQRFPGSLLVPFVRENPEIGLSKMDLIKTYTHFMTDTEFVKKPSLADDGVMLDLKLFLRHDIDHAKLVFYPAENLSEAFDEELLRSKILDRCIELNNDSVTNILFDKIHEYPSNMKFLTDILKTTDPKNHNLMIDLSLYSSTLDTNFKQKLLTEILSFIDEQNENSFLSREAQSVLKILDFENLLKTESIDKIHKLFFKAIQNGNTERVIDLGYILKMKGFNESEVKGLLNLKHAEQILDRFGFFKKWEGFELTKYNRSILYNCLEHSNEKIRNQAWAIAKKHFSNDPTVQEKENRIVQTNDLEIQKVVNIACFKKGLNRQFLDRKIITISIVGIGVAAGIQLLDDEGKKYPQNSRPNKVLPKKKYEDPSTQRGH